MDKPLVSIVLITYNGKELLARYLPTIVSLSYNNKEIIIVDNASTDGTKEFLEQNFPQVQVIRTEKNEGTAEGSNIGARAAKGDLIFWLHNDMHLAPYTLDRMVTKITSSERIGICTCKVKKMTAEGEFLNTIDSVGGGLDKYGFPVARGMGEEDKAQYDDIEKTFFAFGGPLMIKTHVFNELGGMDPYTFTLADDIDLCWRCWLLGYDVVVDTGTVIYHRLSATLSSFARENKRYLSERNTLRMLIKNYSSTSLLRALPVYLALVLAEICFFIAVRKTHLVWADLRAIGWNLVHLGNTLHERRKVQRTRRAKDSEMSSFMEQRSFKLAYFKWFMSNRSDPAWQSYLNTK
ncbi:glycosyltransferase family 2 protein [Nitrososphaera sp.]|uniref:glycosyltransferase family 2 protein n=1 Tax=Nitrososphaera sp. TaxID=1971748 RepID=UPI00317C7451